MNKAIWQWVLTYTVLVVELVTAVVSFATVLKEEGVSAQPLTSWLSIWLALWGQLMTQYLPASLFCTTGAMILVATATLGRRAYQSWKQRQAVYQVEKLRRLLDRHYDSY